MSLALRPHRLLSLAMLGVLLLVRPAVAQEPVAEEPVAPAQPAAAAPAVSAQAEFEAGQQALAGEDYATAFGHFEAALEAEPNNLRYGSVYRQGVIAAGAYERCIGFFTRLVAAHPDAPNAFLNLGYAMVDKIPTEGAITQVLIANAALGHFSKALELEDSWLGRYTRGNSYLYWPAIFGRTPLAVADFERAIELAKDLPRASYHGRVWVGLGDASWRLDDVEEARRIWREGQKLYPEEPGFEARLSLDDAALDEFLEDRFDAHNRVDTDLSVTWTQSGGPQP